MVFRAFHVFVDTSVLVKIIYAITLYHKVSVSKRPPRILGMLENGILTIYTDNAVINELKDTALPNLLSNVNRTEHGWPNIKPDIMILYCIDELNYLVSRNYIRIAEEDRSLEKQRRALGNRPQGGFVGGMV